MAGILRRLLARLTRTTADPEQRRVAPPGRTAAGVRVTPDTAMRTAAVWACHRYLTQTVGQLPARVMREMPGGWSERAPNHPTAWVLNWRANAEMGPFQLKETLVGHALLWGNGYAEIERDAVGRVTALWPIHPERVTVKRDLATGGLVYEVDNGTGGRVTLAPMDVFHLRGFGDGPIGYSVVEYAAQSIGWAQATEIFGARFFGDGLNGSGVIEVTGGLSPEGKTALEDSWMQRYGNILKRMRPKVLDAGMKWVKTSTAPNEAQFIETMQHQVEEVCRWFGVPPHKVMHLLRATFGNIEHQAIEVVTDAIAPWAIRFEEEANYKLFGRNRMGHFVKLDLKGLLRGDFKSRQDGLKVMRDEGVISADEWRELEDMGPIGAAGGGQKRIVQVNMTTLEKIGEDPPAPMAPPAPPPANVFDPAIVAAVDALYAAFALEKTDA